MARTKAPLKTGITKDVAAEAANRHAKAQQRLKAIEAEIEAKTNAARAKYADEIVDLQATTADTFATLQAYAESVRDEEFVSKKSQDWGGVILGFRKGTPKTATRKGFTWASVLENLKLRELSRFIRTKEEADKDAMLTAVANEEDNTETLAALYACGVEIKQDESFFVEVKEENFR